MTKKPKTKTAISRGRRGLSKKKPHETRKAERVRLQGRVNFLSDSRDQLDLELKEQREELLHVTRVGKMAEFVSSLAHEISQPLTAILSYAQGAKRMLGNREPEIQEILQYIINDDQRAAEVIRQLRSLLKKSEPQITLLDINALISETVLLLSADATAKKNILKLELSANIPMIKGDRIQLQQVLINLISNSFDAMHGSKQSHQMVIRTLRKDPETILVGVQDTGCGIAPENMTKIFSHFFTSKPDGLGMGLSISRSIIAEHGGILEAKNNPDCGATFYFTLPIVSKQL
jgi:two-component system sensor kinase FixL